MGKVEPNLAMQARKATNVSLDVTLVAEARRLGINISRACEIGLTAQIAQEQGRRWKTDNAVALESSNAYVDRHGLPLSGHRQF